MEWSEARQGKAGKRALTSDSRDGEAASGNGGDGSAAGDGHGGALEKHDGDG